MREIKFRAEVPTGKGWMAQYYVSTIPNRGYKTQGYIMRKVKNHLFANKRGYVPEHRLVLEEKMGRFLMPRKELVHHIDGDRSNNSLRNLKLSSPTEHPKGHIGERNQNGQFVANDPIFSAIKIRLLNKNTGEFRPYTLCELIGKTYRKGQFEFRGRFTGLCDKNGKEIFEGDIVDCCRPEEVWCFKGAVEWHDEGAIGWTVADRMLNSKDVKYYEIIGNIYEHGDLLKNGT